MGRLREKAFNQTVVIIANFMRRIFGLVGDLVSFTKRGQCAQQQQRAQPGVCVRTPGFRGGVWVCFRGFPSSWGSRDVLALRQPQLQAGVQGSRAGRGRVPAPRGDRRAVPASPRYSSAAFWGLRDSSASHMGAGGCISCPGSPAIGWGVPKCTRSTGQSRVGEGRAPQPQLCLRGGAGPQPGCRSHRMLISSWPACASPFKEGSFVFMAEASKVPGVRRTKRASPGAGARSGGGLRWLGVGSGHACGCDPGGAEPPMCRHPSSCSPCFSPGCNQSCALGTWSTQRRGSEPPGAGAGGS